MFIEEQTPLAIISEATKSLTNFRYPSYANIVITSCFAKTHKIK